MDQIKEKVRQAKSIDSIAYRTRNNKQYFLHLHQRILAKYSIKQRGMDTEDGKFRYTQLAEQVARRPFPQLTTDAWRAHLGEVATVYSQAKLEGLWKLQRNIERLFALYSFFCEAREERNESNRFHGSHVGMFIGQIGFVDSVNVPTKEFKSLIETILEFNETDSKESPSCNCRRHRHFPCNCWLATTPNL